jgi:hypothetical protein
MPDVSAMIWDLISVCVVVLAGAALLLRTTVGNCTLLHLKVVLARLVRVELSAEGESDEPE